MSDAEDLLSLEQVVDPHPYFHRIRRDDPVHWNPCHRSWIVTRYDDVEQASRDARLSSDRVRGFLDAKRSEGNRELFDPFERLLANWMVNRDPPDHGRLRKLVHKAFTQRSVEELAGSVAAVVDARVDALLDAGRGDFLDLLAGPVPSIVIARLLGVPEEDHERFRRWSDEITALVFVGVGDADRHRRAHASFVALERYFRDLLAERRRHPREDLLTSLVRAEEAGDRLSSDEVVANCILLLFAGHETTTNLLGSGLLALLRHPSEWLALRGRPELAGTAVEETLRYDGPSKMMVRFVAEDLELRGKALRRGERVFLAHAAANRDPERFADPDRFSLARHFDEHVGFGYGIHYCLGAPLARMEGRIAFERMARHLGAIELDGTPEWQPTLVARSLRRLPVAIRPA